MLTVIIFLIAIFIFGIYMYRHCKESLFTIIMLCILIFMVGMLIILGCPFAGYSDVPIVEESDLLPIVETDTTDYYLIPSEDYLYTYRLSGEANQYGIAENDIKTLSGTKIQYFEEAGRTTGVLKKYVYKANRNLFVIALGVEYAEYVFLIPQGSVLK